MDYRELRDYHDLQQSGFDTVRLRVQLGKKMSYPLITLVMAVLAIPFAVSGRTGGALAGVAFAIAIAVIYIGTSGLFEAMGTPISCRRCWPRGRLIWYSGSGR